MPPSFLQPRRPAESSPVASTSTKSSSPSLLRSVSAVFKKKQGKRLKVPPIPGIGRSASATPTASNAGSDSEEDPEEVEIRRPSGLGRSCSRTSLDGVQRLRSPSTVSLPSPVVARFSMPLPTFQFDDSPLNPYRGRSDSFSQLFGLQQDPGPIRFRAKSSPQPSPTLGSWPAPVFTFPFRAVSAVPLIASSNGTRPVLPSEIVLEIVEFLPIAAQPELACVSPTFRKAVRQRLYTRLDVDACERRGALLDVLASNHELAAIVTVFKWERWSEDDSDEMPGALSLSLAVALSRMANLADLTLPSFEVQLFGALSNSFHLTALTLQSTSISSAVQAELFAWLEGQATITSLSLPTARASPQGTPPVDLIPTLSLDQRLSATTQYLTLPTKLITPSTTPMTPAFPPGISVPSSFTGQAPLAPTLLPNLTHLHGPMSFVLLLAGRPLKRVTVIIDQSLYTGLRPSGLMSALAGGGGNLKTLHLRFGGGVDKRTIEKVLATAGATLGGENENLRELIVEVDWGSVDGEDTVYRMIPAVLPRFRKVETLRLHKSARGAPLVPLSGAEERTHLQAWVKHCPWLKRVELLDGSTWIPADDGRWNVLLL